MAIDSTRDCQVYLLAAGRGRRAGGPKAWRDCGGRPLLQRQLEFLGGVFPAGRVAVSVQAGWEAACRTLPGAALWVPADPGAPALASLLALARALPLDRWTFLLHVDMRVWDPEAWESLARLIPRARQEGWDALVPVHEGRRGHPVLLGPDLRSGLLALDPAQDRLDSWLRGRCVREVPVSCASIRDNWNS